MFLGSKAGNRSCSGTKRDFIKRNRSMYHQLGKRKGLEGPQARALLLATGSP